jgi:hypothetical protein
MTARRRLVRPTGPLADRKHEEDELAEADCKMCEHPRDDHWWQEPSHPDGGILRCKECERTWQEWLR